MTQTDLIEENREDNDRVACIMRNFPNVIPARRRGPISWPACRLRKSNGVARQPWFRVTEFLNSLPERGDLQLEICRVADLREMVGTCWKDGTGIPLRTEVFVAAKRGAGESRQTVAQEPGQWLLHRDVPRSRTRTQSPPPTALEVPEQEAYLSVDELLMPSRLVRRVETAASAMERFGVPRKAAVRRPRWLRR